MIGAIEILIIVVIAGIIFSKDVIDRTWRKSPDETVAESFAVDVKDYYEKNPKKLIYAVIGSVAAFAFIVVGVYWAFTRTELPRMLGLE